MFNAADRETSPRVAIVNEAFAKEYLGSSPIGKRVHITGKNGPSIEIVGVTTTAKAFSLIEPPVQAIYLPLTQNPSGRMTLIAETTGDPQALAGPLQRMVHSIDPNMSVFRVRTMADLFEHSSVNTIRTVGKVYDSTAALGLLLALAGLYAVVSYQVSRRTREIGIRTALGAERLQVMSIFVKQAAMMSGVGILTGLVFEQACRTRRRTEPWCIHAAYQVAAHRLGIDAADNHRGFNDSSPPCRTDRATRSIARAVKSGT